MDGPLDRAKEIERLTADRLGRIQTDDDRIGDVRPAAAAMNRRGVVKPAVRDRIQRIRPGRCVRQGAAGSGVLGRLQLRSAASTVRFLPPRCRSTTGFVANRGVVPILQRRRLARRRPCQIRSPPKGNRRRTRTMDTRTAGPNPAAGVVEGVPDSHPDAGIEQAPGPRPTLSLRRPVEEFWTVLSAGLIRKVAQRCTERREQLWRSSTEMGEAGRASHWEVVQRRDHEYHADHAESSSPTSRSICSTEGTAGDPAGPGRGAARHHAVELLLPGGPLAGLNLRWQHHRAQACPQSRVGGRHPADLRRCRVPGVNIYATNDQIAHGPSRRPARAGRSRRHGSESVRRGAVARSPGFRNLQKVVLGAGRVRTRSCSRSTSDSMRTIEIPPWQAASREHRRGVQRRQAFHVAAGMLRRLRGAVLPAAVLAARRPGVICCRHRRAAVARLDRAGGLTPYAGGALTWPRRRAQRSAQSPARYALLSGVSPDSPSYREEPTWPGGDGVQGRLRRTGHCRHPTASRSTWAL